MIGANPSGNVLFRRAAGLGCAHGIVGTLGAVESSGVHINLAGVDFVSLRLVVRCAELGSLSAAARQGNMSLSSASHRLGNIEEFFSSQLFDRDYRGLRLTPAGEVFVGYANSILQSLYRLGNQLASMNVRDPIRAVPGDSTSGPVEALQRYEYQVSRGA